MVQKFFVSKKPDSPHLERAMGIEPTSKAWEALILPMNYARDNVKRLELSSRYLLDCE